MAGKGGARPGAGRPKGPTKRTLAKRRGEARALEAAEITAERVILELARLAFADRRGIWEGDRLKPIAAWTADEAALLEGFEAVVKNAEAGDGHTDRVHKVKLATKHHALELLAKHFGLVTEKVKISGSLKLEELVVGSMLRPPEPS